MSGVNSGTESASRRQRPVGRRVAASLASSPVDPAWGLSGAALAAFGLGYGVGEMLGPEGTAIGSAITALFIAVAGLAAPKGTRSKAAPAAAIIAFVGVVLAHLTTGDPVISGLAMAGVMFLASISRAGGVIPAVFGALLGSAYFLPALVGYTNDVSTPDTLLLGVIGAGSALVTVGLLARLVDPLELPKPSSGSAEGSSSRDDKGSLARIAAAALTRSADRAYAVRRALLLGVAIGLYQASGSHNVFWVALAIFAVLGPDEASTWGRALNRSIGTIAGALLLGALAQVLPAEVVIGIGGIALIVAVAFYARNYAVYSAGVAMLVVALFGASDDQFFHWAGLRILDTAIGAAIAIASLYLIPYRDTGGSDGEPGPAAGAA